MSWSAWAYTCVDLEIRIKDKIRKIVLLTIGDEALFIFRIFIPNLSTEDSLSLDPFNVDTSCRVGSVISNGDNSERSPFWTKQRALKIKPLNTNGAILIQLLR